MKLAIAFLVIGLLFFGCLGGQPQTTAPTVKTTAVGEETTPNVINVPAEVPDNQESSPSVSENDATVPESSEPAVQPDKPSAEAQEGKTKEVSYKTKDAWEIHGTLHYAPGTENPETLIILVHGYGQDRSAFDPLIPVLKERLSDMDVLAIDIRGHGESTNLGTYDKFIVGDYIAMKNDIGGAIPYMQTIRPSLSRFYLVGSSIGSSAALSYAVNDANVDKVVMISPGLDYRGLNAEKANWDYIHGLYLSAANGDVYSRNSANTLYEDSPSDNKQLKIYDELGDVHGTDMFAATANSEQPLTELIGIWLQE